MLLDGSYLKDVEKILDALKVVRRGLIREGLVKVCYNFDIPLFNIVNVYCAHMNLLTPNITNLRYTNKSRSLYCPRPPFLLLV